MPEPMLPTEPSPPGVLPEARTEPSEPRIISRLKAIQETLAMILFENEPSEASKEVLLVTLAETSGRLEALEDDIRDLVDEVDRR